MKSLHSARFFERSTDGAIADSSRILAAWTSLFSARSLAMYIRDFLEVCPDSNAELVPVHALPTLLKEIEAGGAPDALVLSYKSGDSIPIDSLTSLLCWLDERSENKSTPILFFRSDPDSQSSDPSWIRQICDRLKHSKRKICRTESYQDFDTEKELRWWVTQRGSCCNVNRNSYSLS